MKNAIITTLAFLICSPLFAQDYKKGAYYDNNRNRHEGYLAVKHMSLKNVILFKENVDGEKQKLKIKDVLAYVVERDSFTAINNFDKYSIPIQDKFAETLEVGRISVYAMHMATISSGTGFDGSPSYRQALFQNPSFISKEVLVVVKNRELYALFKKKHYSKLLPELLADAPSIVDKLKSNYNNYAEVQDLISEYNQNFQGNNSDIGLPQIKLILYRPTKWQRDDSLTLIVNDTLQLNFEVGSYKEMRFRLEDKIKVCIKGTSDCITRYLDPKKINYLECSIDKKSGETSLIIPKTSDAEYSSFGAKQAQDKRSKQKKSN